MVPVVQQFLFSTANSGIYRKPDEESDYTLTVGDRKCNRLIINSCLWHIGINGYGWALSTWGVGSDTDRVVHEQEIQSGNVAS